MDFPNAPSPSTPPAPATFGPPVRFGADLGARWARFAARAASTIHRREGGGRALRVGADAAFDGLRPYRAGDDPRTIDWGLLARSDRVYVRTSRRAAGETWSVVLDASASMGIGRPSKLQAAAEAAMALASLGLALGASVEVAIEGEREAALRLGSARDLGALAARLEGRRAGSLPSLGAPVRRGSWNRAARVFVLGDLFGADTGAWCGLRRMGRELVLVQILGADELAPAARGPVHVLDPERAGRVAVVADAGAVLDYERSLGSWLETWRRQAARRGAQHVLGDSAQTFEERLSRVVLR